jgi:hypothetical protein
MGAIGLSTVGEGSTHICLVFVGSHNHGGEERIVCIPWLEC